MSGEEKNKNISNDEDFEPIEVLDEDSSDELKPGDKVAPGKIVDKNGEVKDSDGKAIVKGAENTAKAVAAVASAGGSEAAAAGEAGAAQGASSAANGANAAKLGQNKNIVNKASNEFPSKIKQGAKEKGKEGIKDKVENKIADKIDKKAERNPFYRKRVKKAAAKARVINSGADTIKSALTLNIPGVLKNGKDFINGVFKESLKTIGSIIKLIVGTLLLGLVLACFVILLILSPLMEVYQNIDSAIEYKENLTNFYNGFGFQNTKEAFFDEMDYLYDYYDHEIDRPLILSTIFYTEALTGYSTDYSELDILDLDDSDIIDSDVNLNSKTIWYSVRNYISTKYHDAYETNEDGLNYTTGKIVRLRKLARHQFKTTMFGSTAVPTKTEEMTLSEYIDRYKDRMSSEVYELVKDVPALMTNSDDKLYQLIKIVEGDESAETLHSGKVDFLTSTQRVIQELFSAVGDLQSITFNCSDTCSIKVKVSKYEKDEDEYKQYLMDYYLDHMPEFRKLIPKNEEEAKKVKEGIISEIYQNADDFKTIFLIEEDADAESYNDSCLGSIDSELLSYLQKPVDIASDKTVSFSDEEGYGIVNGKQHNGIDLNDANAGVKQGDNVYSSYDGKVVEIKSDNTTSNKKSNKKTTDTAGQTDANKNDVESGGTTIKIEHEVEIEKKSYKFYTVYKNIDSSSVTLKENDRVKKGDTIGKIGSTTSGVSQLHFEFRKENDTPIDPTNLFIECKTSSGNSYPGDSTEAKIINYLLGAGFDYMQTATIVTNMFYESTYNPEALNEISCKGLVQWCNSRGDNLVNYASSKGKTWQDLNTQLEFLEAELTNSGSALSYASVGQDISFYKSVIDTVKTYTDPNEAVYYYCMNFEAPGQSHCQQRKNDGKGAEWYNDIKTKAFSSSGGSSNSSDNGNGYPEGTYTAGNGIKYKQYRQDVGDWASNGYSEGSIANSGCGPTSVAILASGLVSPNITPDRTASDMGGANNGGTNYLKLQAEMSSLGMSNEVIFNPSNDDILNALRSNKVMLVGVDAPSIFTGYSHLMTVVDVNSSGQVYVINPNSAGGSSSPSGWYSPSTLTNNSGNYIITTPAVKVAK